MRRTVVLGLFMLAVCASNASAQLPIRFSVNGGFARPIRNETEVYENGFHVGIGAKVALIPIQVDLSYDKMGGKVTNSDAKILSAGLSLPIQITPPLLPVSAYVIVGGAYYRVETVEEKTDLGVNGGAGVRFGLGGVGVFIEGRGVAVLSETNKLTYVTAALGIRL